jgi:hypothetical protein
MKNLIKRLLREGLILKENKLYPDNIITAATNRIGDKSDDTINKLAIAGLYRTVFGDVQQLKSKEQLDTVFNDWYDNTIENLIKTPSFIDNKPLATKYLDAYIKNIKSLGNNAKPFSFKKVEQGLVDVVNNNRWIEDTSIKQGHSIHNPKSEDVVYEDDNIIILDTNTKAKCVMYGQGESWCITKPELNYYNTYRIKYGATPYFVLQKNEPHPEHKLVIMHYKHGYAIADQTNSGNRSGGNQYSNGPWSDIEREIPNLRGLEKYFPYREISNDEIKYDEIVKKTKGYQGDNLQGYIDNVIKGLVINGSQVEAVDFIRDYASEGNKITDGQLKSLRPEVIDSLIETGYFLNYLGQEQIELLSDKQRLRVVRLKMQNNKTLNYGELSRLPKEEWFNAFKFLSINSIAYFFGDYEGDIDKIVTTYPDKINKFLETLSEDYAWKLIYVLRKSKTPQDIFKILDNKSKEYLSNLTETQLKDLLIFSYNPSEIFKFLGKNGQEFISSFNLNKITKVLTFSSNPENLLQTFGDVGNNYISNLSTYDIDEMLKFGFNPEGVFNVIKNSKAFQIYLKDFDIYNLISFLSFSDNTEKVLNLLGEKTKEYLKDLTVNHIKQILKSSDKPDLVKDLLRKYGHKI